MTKYNSRLSKDKKTLMQNKKNLRRLKAFSGGENFFLIKKFAGVFQKIFKHLKPVKEQRTLEYLLNCQLKVRSFH